VKLPVCMILALGLAGASCRAQFLGTVPGPTEHTTPDADNLLLRKLLTVSRPELTFRPGDVISAQVYGIKDFAVEQRVAEDGTVRFPLLGAVQVAGQTVQNLEANLASQLKNGGFVADPQVIVNAVSQPWVIVTVSGDVTKPGIFPAYGNLTLMDYLSQAGGIVENVLSGTVINTPASSTVTLVRPSLGESVTVPLGPDARNSPWGRIPLLPGDEIRVGRVGLVYAIGALKQQGAFALKNSSPTTVLQVAAMAGGIGYEADRRDACIIRTDGGVKYIFHLDVQKILQGKVADVPLQADDILFVPTNSMKAAIKGGGSGVLVSLAAAYLYSRP
jgi:polysaccharide export outer membrane protein